ncbi:MAG: hypothetical protein ACRDID_06170, partial [Ktedonobacterales bacterium]
ITMDSRALRAIIHIAEKDERQQLQREIHAIMGDQGDDFKVTPLWQFPRDLAYRPLGGRL